MTTGRSALHHVALCVTALRRRKSGVGRLWPATAGRSRAVSLLVAAIGVLAVLLPQDAWAEDGAFVVAEFQGVKPIGIRDQVVSLMQAAGFSVVDSGDAPPVDPGASSGRFAEVAKDGGYRGFVLAYTSMGKSGWATSFTIRTGATGKVVGKRTISAGWYPGLQKSIDKNFISRLGPALDRAQRPAGSTPPTPVASAEAPEVASPRSEHAAVEPAYTAPEFDEPLTAAEDPFADEQATADAASTQAPGSNPPLLTAVEVAAGPTFVQRSWAVNDLIAEQPFGRLAPTHDVPLFGAGFGALFYPAAFATDKGFVRHLGLDASASQSFVGGTRVGGVGEPRQTQFLQWAADVRGRVPFGAVELALFVGLGRQALTIDGDKASSPQPDVKYRFLQAGLDLRWPLGESLTLDALAAYRQFTSFGQAPEQLQNRRWFPNTTGQGVQGRLGLAYGLHQHLRLRLGGHVAGYGLAFNPDYDELQRTIERGATVPPLAGGATDLYWGVDVSIVIISLR